MAAIQINQFSTWWLSEKVAQVTKLPGDHSPNPFFPPPLPHKEIGECGGYKTKVRDMMKERETEVLKWEVHGQQHLEMNEGLREGIGMQKYLHGPMNPPENIETAISGGGLDLPKIARRIRVVG